MIWLLYVPLNLLIMLICYITNPIVVLFATETGELKGFLQYFATWDDSLDPGFFVKEKVPSFLRYDWDRHYAEYEYTTDRLRALGRTRWFVRLKDSNFTIKERIQRYFCRVLWLTRNCGYGFSFYWFGKLVEGMDVRLIEETDGDGLSEKLAYDPAKSILTRPWMYKNTRKICSWLRWEIFCGWKIDTSSTIPQQCMIANRIAVRFL